VKLNVLHKGQDKVVKPLPSVSCEYGRGQGRQRQQRQGRATKGTDVPKLGLTLAPANSVAGAGKDGVVNHRGRPEECGGRAWAFKEGDVILEVAGKSVTNAGDVREAINAARTDNKNSVLMRVKSGGSSRFVAVPLAKG